MKLYLAHNETALADGATTVRLPLVQTGEWNGARITQADLQHACDNFATLRDGYNWVPGVWAKHLGPGGLHGRDARDRLARIDSVQVEGNRLLADVTLLGDAVEAYRQGKFPYHSAEVKWGYQVQDSKQRLPGMTLTGVAFVDDPAIKSVQPAMFANAEEFPQIIAAKPRKQPARGIVQTEGARLMGFMQKFLSLVRQDEDPTPEELAQLEQDAAATFGTPPAGGPEDDKAAQLAQDLAAEKAAREAAEARLANVEQALAESAAQAKAEAVAATVAQLVSEGYLAPANAPLLTALLGAVAGDTEVAYMANGEGGKAERKVALAAGLVELLKANSPQALMGSGGQGLQLLVDADADRGKPSQKVSPERIAALANEAMGKAGKQ